MRKLTGFIVSGLGRGKNFVAKPQYFDPLVSFLGWQPFIGTLNIEFDSEEIIEAIFSNNSYVIPGFIEEVKGQPIQRGSVRVKKAMLRFCQHEIAVGLLRPQKTSHGKILELIAPIEVRREWTLHDGDSIDIYY